MFSLKGQHKKPIHAKWLIEVLSKLEKNTGLILNALTKSGIKNFVEIPFL